MESVTPILEFKKTCVSYTKQTMAVKYVSAAIERNTITAIMGPSGCGKSTLLRAVNLMHNLYPNIHVGGEILLNGEDILSMEPIDVRRRVGMVFQGPTPFPTMSIYDNVLSGFALNGIKLSKAEKDATVERCLKSVALWDEVKDVLNKCIYPFAWLWRSCFLQKSSFHYCLMMLLCILMINDWKDSWDIYKGWTDRCFCFPVTKEKFVFWKKKRLFLEKLCCNSYED